MQEGPFFCTKQEVKLERRGKLLEILAQIAFQPGGSHQDHGDGGQSGHGLGHLQQIHVRILLVLECGQQ